MEVYADEIPVASLGDGGGQCQIVKVSDSCQVLAVLLCCSTARSLPRSQHRAAVACAIAAAAVSALAAAAEGGKLWIPGRHLQCDETLLDVLSAVCGIAAAWAVSRSQRF